SCRRAVDTWVSICWAWHEGLLSRTCGGRAIASPTMCGFAGFHSGRSFPVDAGDLVRHMAEELHHRGPDDAGQYADPDLGIALGFRRLAIVDKSSSGHQPMVSANGRFILVVNGEVYNHLPLRRRLEQAGHSFRGHADSEVLLEVIAAWGLEEALAC